MLRYSRRTIVSQQNVFVRRFSGSCSATSQLEENEHIASEDPHLSSLAKDVEISVRTAQQARISISEESEPEYSIPYEDYDLDPAPPYPWGRKSPAAAFGSRSIGTVALPIELQRSIHSLISVSDKHQLREDAKRIFLSPEDEESWSTEFNKRYRSFQHAQRNGERDGTAFAAIALPAHFSAIYAVLSHLRHRLGPQHKITSVMDWGAATGSGFWAAAYAFQESRPDRDEQDLGVKYSSLVTYKGIDKRDGLVRVARRLVQGVDLNGKSISFQRKYNPERDKIPRSEGQETMALSAFLLSTLSSPLTRTLLVKEMWSSGADLIVLIDHNTTEGFRHLAEARQLILTMAGKEFKDPDLTDNDIRGAHVVAPCAHDRPCPLYQPGPKMKLVCGFAQRLQRPDFLRKTKHSNFGHEDITYSYVAIRRGRRPSLLQDPKVGRIGEVGQREIEKEMEEHVAAVAPSKAPESVPQQELLDEANEDHEHLFPGSWPTADLIPAPSAEAQAILDLEDLLRKEAYHWPRLIFSPIKAHGHIILDGCTAEGKIMRMTIPKSQGKQPYYDARKSSWGDLFPHPPKNPPQERLVSSRTGEVIGGQDIGKRKHRRGEDDKHITYEKISKELKVYWKKSKRDKYRLARREQAGDAEELPEENEERGWSY